MVTWTNTLALYAVCSCSKIGDQGDSWLLNELLKKNGPFVPSSVMLMSLSEKIFEMTAMHGLALCDPWHMLAGPQQPVIPPAAAWV